MDGSHHARDVLQDAVLAWGLLRPGGYMIFDDYEWVSNVTPDKPHTFSNGIEYGDNGSDSDSDSGSGGSSGSGS